MPNQVYIQDIAKHVGEEITIKGWLADRTDKGKLQFLARPRRDRFHPGGRLPKRRLARGRSRTRAELTQESSFVVTGSARAEPRAPGGYELAVKDVQPVQVATDYPITPKDHGVDFLMQHRHLWLRSPRQHAILRIRCAHRQSDPRLARRRRLFASRHADPHAGGGGRDDDPVPDRLFWRAGVPDAERSALQRGGCGRVRQGVLLRPHLPRRKEQDPTPPHRVLDGRARVGIRHASRLYARRRRVCLLRRPDRS